MKDGPKSKIFLALTALLSALLGCSITVVVFLVWPDARVSDAANPTEAKLDPEFRAAIDDLKVSLTLTRQEINGLRLENAETREAVRLLAADTLGEGVETALPPSYVAQVDTFFKSDAAKTLLDAKFHNARNITFGRPRFVGPYLITVPYFVGGEPYFMLVEITVMDLYDLKFDVVWDGMVEDLK